MAEIIVSTTQGKLRGKVGKDFDGNDYYSFQGVPYAKPPVGRLRFKAPEPPESWTGIRDATTEGSTCLSRDLMLQNVGGTEDCLFLNVFTSKLPSKNEVPSKPVMFWIHGGAFTSGSSTEDIYGPEHLVAADIVLVTINYRLGIFGFFGLEDESLGVHGNAGMKDMVMALKWVQKNIAAFGGDPGNVTIFGESAGAASVHYLVLSPLVKGLFHKAIVQSGSALNPYAKGRTLGAEMSKILNLSTTNEREILEHLLSLSSENLFEASEKLTRSENFSTRVYGPIIEKPHDGAFLSENPIDIIKSGSFNRVPIIFGFTSREGMLFELLMKPAKPSKPKNFENVIPCFLGLQQGSEISKQIAEQIEHFYYGDGSEDDVDKFYLLYTDSAFLRDIRLSAILHSRFTPVYLYRMTVESTLNLFKLFGQISAPGVAHGDDIGYLFKFKLGPPVVSGSPEETYIRRFVKLWSNFAKTGDPNTPNSHGLKVTWKQVNEQVINFLDIGKELTTGVNPEPERMMFWEKILAVNPKYKIKRTANSKI